MGVIAPLLGGKNRASEILSGKRSLTVQMIRSLNEAFEIQPGLLIREPKAEYTLRRHRAGKRRRKP
jgi:HTH-type transcriptional regulator/antitoxin HigA